MLIAKEIGFKMATRGWTFEPLIKMFSMASGIP